jgi:O-acetyl-ADP-ribose deacetylase
MKETIIPKIEVRKGSITTLQADAIVNPANSFGYMGGGVAGAIKLVGGQEIEDEAIQKAPIQVGEAVLTAPGYLICKAVIHAPTMHEPAEKTDAHKVSCAIEAALSLADSEGFRSLAIPGMGTGVGGLPQAESARIIVRAIKKMKFSSIERIILVDIDEKMVSCFEKELKRKK